MAASRRYKLDNPPPSALVVEAGSGEAGKHCSDCGRYLTLSSYHRYTSSSDGLQRMCRYCKWLYKLKHSVSHRRTTDKSDLAAGRYVASSEQGVKKRMNEFLSSGRYKSVASNNVEQRMAAYLAGEEDVYLTMSNDD